MTYERARVARFREVHGDTVRARDRAREAALTALVHRYPDTYARLRDEQREGFRARYPDKDGQYIAHRACNAARRLMAHEYPLEFAVLRAACTQAALRKLAQG